MTKGFNSICLLYNNKGNQIYCNYHPLSYIDEYCINIIYERKKQGRIDPFEYLRRKSPICFLVAYGTYPYKCDIPFSHYRKRKLKKLYTQKFQK